MDIQDIENEIDELERVSQDLSRDEGIEISVDTLKKVFEKTKETTLTDDVWEKLENTESNEIVKGDIDAVKKIAKKYQKTSPDILVKAIKSGEYKRPMIIKFDDGRYHLVAGNTRLCTAKAMGVNPKVFIANIEDMKNKKETKEQTTAGSSGSFEAPLFSKPIRKKDIHKIPNFNESEEIKEVTDASSSGAYDVPFGGGGRKGRKNPLKIDGPDSIKNSRAVTDPEFPKWGGPGGVFIRVKEKCKKFPYCNQGDINAIERLREAINETSKNTGIPINEIENIVLNEIKRIFI